jgi:hypothetical protein
MWKRLILPILDDEARAVHANELPLSSKRPAA